MEKTLIIVRHGLAGDREEFRQTGKPDSERPLTKFGKKKMKAIAKWLSRKVSGPFDIVADSPLVRSQQTLDILCEDLKFSKRSRLKELDPKTEPKDLMKALDKMKVSSVLVVGHEPHVSDCFAYLMKTAKTNNSPFKFKKGGVACFSIEGSFADGLASLNWQVTPKLIIEED